MLEDDCPVEGLVGVDFGPCIEGLQSAARSQSGLPVCICALPERRTVSSAEACGGEGGKWFAKNVCNLPSYSYGGPPGSAVGGPLVDAALEEAALVGALLPGAAIQLTRSGGPAAASPWLGRLSSRTSVYEQGRASEAFALLLASALPEEAEGKLDEPSPRFSSE